MMIEGLYRTSYFVNNHLDAYLQKSLKGPKVKWSIHCLEYIFFSWTGEY